MHQPRKPAGLPQHVAGTFDTTRSAGDDADLTGEAAWTPDRFDPDELDCLFDIHRHWTVRKIRPHHGRWRLTADSGRRTRTAVINPPADADPNTAWDLHDDGTWIHRHVDPRPPRPLAAPAADPTPADDADRHANAPTGRRPARRTGGDPYALRRARIARLLGLLARLGVR